MRYVYDFAEGSNDQKDLLGGKGAGLAEMTNLGLRVPPGFTITTEACRAFMEGGEAPAGLWDDVAGAIRRLEESTGRSFGGGGTTPLLVSVRSGAKFSMPGMMDTVLNLGINDIVVKEIAERAGRERVAWDIYRRFLQMFGKVVLGVPGDHFEEVLTELRRTSGVESDAELDAGDLETATGTVPRPDRGCREEHPSRADGAIAGGGHRGVLLVGQPEGGRLSAAPPHPR